jgi:hypothetical protein
MAQANKNQHWVPQFYLEYFAIPGTQRIWAFPIHEGKEFNTIIRNVAAQSFLYSPRTADGNRDHNVDNELWGLENLLSQLWPRIANDHYFMGDGFRKGLSLFIASLFLRHPSKLDSHRRLRQNIINVVKAAPTDNDGIPQISSFEVSGKSYPIDWSSWENYRDGTEEDLKASWGKMILGTTGVFAQHLLNQPWSIIFSTEPVFATSDHPVAVFHPDVRNPNLTAPGSVVFFPISPTRMLVIGDRRFEDGLIYPLKPGREAFFNFFIFRACHRYLFTPWTTMRTLAGIVAFCDETRAEEVALVHRAAEALRSTGPKVGRNNSCPCGSGIKYKRCCGS